MKTKLPIIRYDSLYSDKIGPIRYHKISHEATNKPDNPDIEC